MRALFDYPELGKVLSNVILTTNSEATFTAIQVARNMDRGMHRDYNNARDALNYVYPIRRPTKGGELWVELSPGDRVRGEIMEHEDEQGQRRYGQVLPDSTHAEGHVYSVFPSKATSSSSMEGYKDGVDCVYARVPWEAGSCCSTATGRTQLPCAYFTDA